MPERGWYLKFSDPDGILDGLLGPMVGGRERAEEIAALLLDREQKIADAVDWSSPAVCAPYWFATVEVIDLSPAEIEALNAGGVQ